MYQRKTERRLSPETREKMSKTHRLLNTIPEYKKKRSESCVGTKNPTARYYLCTNDVSGDRVEVFLKDGLKKFCVDKGLYLHLLLKIVNKNQTYMDWRVASKRLYELKKEKLEKENRYYVYIYLDPRKRGKFIYENFSFKYEPFYVGKGGRGDNISNKRWRHHLVDAQLDKNGGINRHKHGKIKHILESGLEPIIEKVKTFKYEKDSLVFEKVLINIIGRKDLEEGPLTNMTDGGFDKNFSYKTREKISNSLKAHIPWNRYKKISEEQKKAISVTVSRVVRRSPVKIDDRKVYKPKKKIKVYKYSEDIRKRMSERSLGRVPSNKGIKTGRPSWNKGLHIISNKVFSEEEKINRRKNSPLNRPVGQYDIDGNLLAIYQSQRDASRNLGIRREGIKDCCSGRQLSAHGFIWKFMEEVKYGNKDSSHNA